MEIKRTDAEIDAVLNDAVEGDRFAGMTYEQGVEAAILWITGQTDSKPMED